MPEQMPPIPPTTTPEPQPQLEPQPGQYKPPVPMSSDENWYKIPDYESEKSPESVVEVGSAALSSEIELSPAGKLGVVDGEFNVVRSDGTVEKGWSVYRALWRDKKGAYRVTISKPNPEEDGGVLLKNVPAGSFARWQEPITQDLEQPSKNPGIIDKVPNSEEEFEVADQARIDEVNKPIIEQLDAVDRAFDEFKSKFTEEQTLNMWKYAAGLMNKRDAQQRGDGNASYAYERQASEGLNGLKTAELKSAADEYLKLMQQASYLRSRLK